MKRNVKFGSGLVLSLLILLFLSEKVYAFSFDGFLSSLNSLLDFFSPSPPAILNAKVEPVKVEPSDWMIITAEVEDKYGIKRVYANMSGIDVVNLTLSQGNSTYGIWQGKWFVHGVKVGKDYNATITAVNIKGKKTSVKVAFHDDPVFCCRREINASSTGAVNISIDTSYLISRGWMRPDCGDIRFTDSKSFDSALWERNFGYSIWECNTTNTKILVNNPSSHFYMYYGNPEVTQGPQLKWLVGLRYRKPITINNTLNNQNLTDYQVKLTINTANLISQGKMNSNCSDIRFTYVNASGEYEIPYWIESGCNSDNTIIWIKVPFIPDNNTDIGFGNGIAKVYMYYGNPSAESESNCSSVFIFFDDFDEYDVGTSNPDNWTHVQSNYITHDITVQEDGNRKVLEIKGVAKDLVERNRYIYAKHNVTVNTKSIIEFCHKENVDDSNFRVKVIVDGNEVLSIAGTTSDYITSNVVVDEITDYLEIGHYFAGLRTGTIISNLDWVRVRKYANQEPTYSIGSEEQEQLAEVGPQETWVRISGLLISGLKIK